MQQITFIDLFAGIGGFHLAFHALGARCVFASENDIHARRTYEENIQNIAPKLFTAGMFAGDIQNVRSNNIPNFDILCAGFPCQPFSQIGFKKGFYDNTKNRGNMFFEIIRILKAKKPKAFFLENVRNLEKHDSGNTFATIKYLLEELGYSFHYKLIRASDFGLPQHRPRIFMVGFLGETTKESTFIFPEKQPLNYTMSDIFNGHCNKKIGFTLRVGGRGSKITDRRNWEFYYVDGEIRRVGIQEALRMQGFPENFIFPVSTVQAMKQLGNSVAINAVHSVANNIICYLRGDTLLDIDRLFGLSSTKENLHVKVF